MPTYMCKVLPPSPWPLTMGMHPPWGFHFNKGYFLKYFIRFLYFLSEKIFLNFFLFENFDISENNIISVKLARVPWYHLFPKKHKKDVLQHSVREVCTNLDNACICRNSLEFV
jgi:hypothetical protein